MSRLSLIEELYCTKKSAFEFDYDKLWAPPIGAYFTNEDVDQLYKIATSLKYNANIDMKYKLIGEIMERRGFRFAHAGTNRVVYNCLDNPTIVAKVAVDRVGLTDSPSEFKNQEYLKPFCCKIFEVTHNGVLALVERVNPITSLEEFISVAEDVYNLITKKIIGKYVLDDIGANRYTNYGCRSQVNGYMFGPVILDFPYVYELDGAKLYCNHMNNMGQICGGEIDYTPTFSHLQCTKCGRKYHARDLSLNKSNDIKIKFEEGKGENKMSRARIINGETGEVIMESRPSSKTYISKDQYREFNASRKFLEEDEVVVTKQIFLKNNKKENYKNNTFEDARYKIMKESGFDLADSCGKIVGMSQSEMDDTNSVKKMEGVNYKFSNKKKKNKGFNNEDKNESNIIDESMLIKTDSEKYSDYEYTEPDIDDDFEECVVVKALDIDNEIIDVSVDSDNDVNDSQQSYYESEEVQEEQAEEEEELDSAVESEDDNYNYQEQESTDEDETTYIEETESQEDEYNEEDSEYEESEEEVEESSYDDESESDNTVITVNGIPIDQYNEDDYIDDGEELDNEEDEEILGLDEYEREFKDKPKKNTKKFKETDMSNY